jgi:hypothetical protein
LTSEGLREVDLSIKVPIIGLIVNPIAEIDGSVDLKGRLELSGTKHCNAGAIRPHRSVLFGRLMQ